MKMGACMIWPCGAKTYEHEFLLILKQNSQIITLTPYWKQPIKTGYQIREVIVHSFDFGEIVDYYWLIFLFKIFSDLFFLIGQFWKTSMKIVFESFKSVTPATQMLIWLDLYINCSDT